MTLRLSDKDFKEIWGDPEEEKRKHDEELIKKYGKLTRKFHNKEEIIKKWGKNGIQKP